MNKIFRFRVLYAVMALVLLLLLISCNSTTPDPGNWPIETPQTTLTASGKVAHDDFGNSVAIYGDTAVVGDDQMNAAYVFTRNGTTWTQQAKLTLQDSTADEYFGGNVTLYGDTAIITGGSSETGEAAYVFTRSGTIWTQQAELIPSDDMADDQFGDALSLYGDTVIIGSLGHYDTNQAAYIFTRSGTIWTQQAKLTGSDSLAGDDFGDSVSLYGDTAVVGADSLGAAYIFTRSGTAWSQQDELIPSNGFAGDAFGCSVSIYEDTIVAGACYQAGSAYIFTRNGTTWTQQTQLTQLYGISQADLKPSDLDGYLSGSFGKLVGVFGDTVVITGADLMGGAVFVFTGNGSTWTRQARVNAPNSFGSSISLYGNMAIIGGISTKNGAAYVLNLNSAQ